MGLRPVIFTDKSRLINLHFVFYAVYFFLKVPISRGPHRNRGST